MTTVILGTTPPELHALIERRQKAGADRLDEVWEGVLHMPPAPSGPHADVAQQLAELLGPLARAAGLYPTMHEFNVGESEHDFRVPDGGLHRHRPAGLWHPTVALVVEIVSPGDETWSKLPFYATHHLDELLIIDPVERTVQWLALQACDYRPLDRSRLIDAGPGELTGQIDWP